MTKGQLFIKAITKLISGFAIIGALLFIPAGTWHYWQAWLFILLLLIPMLLVGMLLLFKSPELLKKRLNSKEKEQEQKAVVLFSTLMFFASFLLAGFDRRYGWSDLPLWLVIVAATVMLCGYAVYAEVMRENAYLSRTVEIQNEQKVISTGLYGIVRHPMYAATLVLYMSMPLVLGSWPALIPMLLYPLIIIKRILNEEQVLSTGLQGYTEYKQKVKYRLIPFIW
ncbi:MAG: methyltransferase family protein [Candidatus Limimorpha sp.]